MKKLKLINIFIKELKEIILDKNRLVILALGPIFLTLLFGGVYINSYIENIPIAVLDEDDSSYSRMIIQQFNENERFDLRYEVNNRQELEKLLNDKSVYMGIYIPINFSQDITELKSTEVLILVDGTNMIIGNNAYAGAANIIQTIAAGTQIKILEAKGISPNISYNLSMPFQFNERTLYDPKMTYMNYLLMGFIAVFLQQIILSGFGMGLVQNGEEISQKGILKKIIIKLLSTAIFAIASISISIYMASNLFNIQIRGSMMLALLMMIVFIFAISCPTILIAAFVKDKLKFTQIAFMLSLPTFATCGYVWTIDQLPQALVNGLKIFWPLIYFARPFDEVLIKGIGYDIVKENIIGMGIYTLIWMPIAIYIFKKRYRVT